jgi:hypothetical protein
VEGFLVRRAVALAFALAAALGLPDRAAAAGPSLTLEVVSADTIRVIAPADRPAYLTLGRNASGLGIFPAGLPGLGEYPSFAAAAIPAPCSSGYYGYGLVCPPAIRHVELMLGDDSDFVDASVGLGADTPGIFGLSMLLSAFRRTCLTSAPPASDLTLTVSGGAGDDTILGSPGDDVLSGGPGRDLILPGTGHDVVRGDSGFDAASFCGTQAPVALSLDDVANDGVAGQGANIRSDIEDLVGGDGNDTLAGDGASNRLVGGLGGDALDGGAGPDALAGGDGDDRLSARDNVGEELDCGAGDDVAVIDVDEEPAGCEHVDRPAALELDGDHDTSPKPIDCDDANAAIRPGQPDKADDGIDQDCDGRDAVDLDRDRDGSPRPADCDDGDPGISPRAVERSGDAVDEDCDGVAEPLRRVTTLVDYAFFAKRASTRVVRLRAVGVAAGTVLRVTCRGGGCPKRAWSRRYRSRVAAVDLRAIGLHRLRPGATLEVRITQPGALGKTLRFRMRSSALPAVVTGCLDPASGRRRAC